MREPILNRLERRIVVCDGAMGTMLYSKGISLSRCYDELNLSSPQLVKDVHVGYVKAGADMLETNTFGANRYRLEKPGLAGRVREINLAGARLAREVAGEELYVAGAVGPLGVHLEPLGPTSLDEAHEAFREQIGALAEGGVDLIIIETMIDVQEAHQALLAAREVAPSLPVVVQMTIQDDGSTPAGTLPEDFTPKLDEWGADLIGINCSVGPATVLETLERMAPLTTRKLSAQPNAGLPRTVDGRNFYLCSPEYMANFAQRFIQAGVRLVGGCCGTTPEHIKAIKAAVKSLTPNPARAVVATPASAPQAMAALPAEKRSPLGEKLAHGNFPVLVEIIPPKGGDPSREVEGARYVKEQGLDAVNIPDGSGATARMSALTLAALLGQRVGVDVVLHFSAQDRTVLGIQSDLLGAHALGIRNVLALTRDSTQFTSNPESHATDVDSIGVVNILNNLNRGLDAGGNPLGTQTGFLIGVGVNPQSENMEREVRRFEYKVEAGANFALALPVFDVARLAAFLRRIEPITGGRFPVLAGIWPLTSFRNAEFLNNEVPGITIPPSIMERMRKADTGDRARAEGVKIAQESLLEIRDMVQGIQIAAPFGRYALAVEVAQVLGHAEKVKG